MKLSLLLLWSLVNPPLQGLDCNCQGGMGQGGAGGAAYGLNSSNSGYSDGYGALNSPVANYGGGGGGGGRCSKCCRDSTCDMYQHMPYFPVNHGYYYFRPYNYVHVWKHQQWVTTIGGDPRNPYSRALFIPIYEQFENTTYEPDQKPSSTLNTLPTISNQLPDLEKLLKGQTADNPEGTPIETPAPPAPAPENK
jgi:hypothetical protein